jgi:ribosomal protein L11 methyltransferase
VANRQSRRFTEITFEIPAESAEDAAGLLNANGALGCEFVNRRTRRRSPGENRLSIVRAYFDRPSAATVRQLASMLKNAGMMMNGAAPATRVIEDPGWATMWQRRFSPLRIGDRLLIVPPWSGERDPDRIRIAIQPGRAFGTGHHGSTWGTLTAVERILARRAPNRALDVGTGSGILAIAMHKLGVREVTAIDIDPVALENAAENADLNHVHGAIRFSAAPLGSIRGRFGLITANILSSVVIALATEIKARMRPAAYLVLSGILVREAQTVLAAYTPDLRSLDSIRRGAWITLVLQR